MSDDEFDLDAMLDATLDEEFAPSAVAEEGVEDDDLDAMLDEALVSGAVTRERGKKASAKIGTK